VTDQHSYSTLGPVSAQVSGQVNHLKAEPGTQVYSA